MVIGAETSSGPLGCLAMTAPGRFSRPVARAVTSLTLVKLVLNGGFRFVYPFLPAIGRGLGVDLNQMGVLLSVRWGVGFGAPLAVRTVHRGDRSRRLLLAGLIAFGVGSLITAISGVFVGALVGFALMGIGKPIFDIGSQTYISERVPYARRARALGILELSWAGGLLLGAPLAGWLISRWGWELPFWVFGTLALLAIGAMYLLLDESDVEAEGSAASPDQPRSVVLGLFAAVAVTGFTHELLLVVLGAWLEADFAMSLAGLAGVGFMLGVAELFGEGAMVAFTDRVGKRASFALGLGVGAVCLTLLAVVNQTAVLGLGSLFLITLALEFAIISGIPLASEYRPNSRSRFLAWFLVVAGLGRIAADLVGPALFASSGMSVVALVAACSAALGVVILFTLVREVDAEQAIRPPL